jgi:Ca2+-binding RTX toxin-like protein
MANNSATMTVAQHAAFTTVSNAGAITFADAGAITAKSAAVVTTYNLANGTNTFTASTVAGSNSVTGGSGADTFNFGLLADAATASFVTDTVVGGTGVDTLNITGNIAFSQTLTNVAGVENIVFGNTSTAVTATLVAGNGTGTTGSITVDASGTSGIVTISASGVDTTVGVNIIGGSGADVLTGGTRADTITGGLGGDSITGGLGADQIDLGVSDGAVDTVVMTGGLTSDTVTTFTAGTGGDKIFIDISLFNTANLVVAATDLDFVEIFDNNSVADAAGTAAAFGLQTLTAAAVAADAKNFFLIDLGATKFANAAAAVDALETGGAAALTFAGNIAALDAFMFAYENSTGGVNIAVASFVAADDNSGGAAATGANNLLGTDIATLTGITDVTTLTVANLFVF